MKKGIFLTLATALMLCFAACQKDDAEPEGNNSNGNENTYSQLVVGTWLVDNMTIDGEPRTPQNLQFTFNAGGTGLMNDNGVTENNEFSWNINGSSITITPHGGNNYVYTINTLTATECSFSGTVVPGTDMTGNVSIHMVKYTPSGNGGDEAFPAGTRWQQILAENQTYYDTLDGGAIDSTTVFVEIMVGLNFANAGHQGTLSMNVFMDGEPVTLFDTYMPFTYTYNAETGEGELTLSFTDEETGELTTGTMPFLYDATENAIIIEIDDEDQDEMGGMERLVLTPVEK